MTPAPLIELRAVSKHYVRGRQRVEVLQSLSLEVPAGEFLALMGPSGSGKTTLLNLIGGLDRCSAGSVRVAGQALEQLSSGALAAWRARHVGFVFQFYNLIPSLTAIENVRLVTDIAEHPMDPAQALALVGLQDRQHHYPAQLSGGEQQRVAVARAVAKQPGVLLCDEPTGALDSATGIRVLETLARANRELGTTVVIITHNAGIAAMAHRVFHFLDGRIARIEVNAAPVDPAGISW